MGDPRRAARRAAHRALGADAVRGAGRHLGRRPQSVSAGRPPRQSEAAAACWSRRCGTGSREIDKRRRGQRATRERDAKVAQLVAAARAAVDRFAASFAETAALRKRTLRVLSPPHATATTSPSTASRASRTSPTPPTGASSIRSSCSIPIPRTRSAGWSRLHRARPHHHPARRRHRLHRRRDSADARSAVINTEKLERLSAVERVVLPGHARAGADDRLRRGCRHAPRDGSRGGGGSRVRRRSDVRRRVVHRRQRRDERRRQEGRAVGHGARQPRCRGGW